MVALNSDSIDFWVLMRSRQIVFIKQRQGSVFRNRKELSNRVMREGAGTCKEPQCNNKDSLGLDAHFDNGNGSPIPF